MRLLARALAARSMLRLGDGDIDGCRDDLIRMHRLGCFLRQNAQLVSALVGVAITGICHRSLETFLNQQFISQDQLRAFEVQMASLPRTSPLADLLDFNERLSTLSAFQMMHEANGNFDINIAMKECNEFYTQVVAAVRNSNDPVAALNAAQMRFATTIRCEF